MASLKDLAGRRWTVLPILATATSLVLLYIWLYGFPGELPVPEVHLPDAHLPWTDPAAHRLPAEPAEEYLAFCVAAKDQEKDLPEFLQHHYYHMNVSHFYIMDDRSEPPISSERDYGIPKTALTFKHYTAEESAAHRNGKMQWHIDDQCMQLYGSKHTWIGFIDVDEFFEVRTTETMEDILRQLEQDKQVGALATNWKTHTSGGLLTRPDSVRESFTVCIDDDDNVRHVDIFPLDKHIKVIVQTSKYASVQSPHQMNLKDGAVTVGEDGRTFQPGGGQRIPITRNRVVLHHYAVKSRQEFEEKMARWKGDIGRKWNFWDNIHGVPSADCPEMRRYVD
jgi:hypothetical protein